LRRRDFWFGFGFPPFGAFYFGPGRARFRAWAWGAKPWGFPKRKEYLEMLKDYRDELLEYKEDLEEELAEVEEEIRRLEEE